MPVGRPLREVVGTLKSFVPFRRRTNLDRERERINPHAVTADARRAPDDGRDLNRCFPGRAHGSYTEVLAAAIAAEALPHADLVSDVHGGGSWCVNAFAGGEDLADASGAPFALDADRRGLGPVTPTTYARSRGARLTAFEMGGRGSRERLWADRIAAGIARALTGAGVLELRLPEVEPPVAVGPTREHMQRLAEEAAAGGGAAGGGGADPVPAPAGRRSAGA